MLVNQFLNTLKNHPEQPLLFEYAPGQTVSGGYHVTEIKNVTVETIDCGNSLHTWQEVVVQVWVPAEAQPGEAPMSTDKFLKIWQTVDRRIPLFAEGEIRVEFHDPAHLPTVYHVDALEPTAEGFQISLAPPRTLCKPREILIPVNDFVEAAADGCCTPANPVHESEKAIPLAVAETQQSCC